ncbi:hypothetical protein X961_5823 [Burkholderia pseudomallei MSHR5613]|nr:hypothetical protein X961_5823 [Burkholderia pseudomallei MSHR5613]
MSAGLYQSTTSSGVEDERPEIRPIGNAGISPTSDHHSRIAITIQRPMSGGCVAPEHRIHAFDWLHA